MTISEKDMFLNELKMKSRLDKPLRNWFYFSLVFIEKFISFMYPLFFF